MQRISIKYMYTNPPNSKYFKVLYGRRWTRQMMTGQLRDNKQRCQTSQQQANKENKMRRTAAKKHQMKNGSKENDNKKSSFSWDLSINQRCLPKRSDQMISNAHTHTHSRMFVWVCGCVRSSCWQFTYIDTIYTAVSCTAHLLVCAHTHTCTNTLPHTRRERERWMLCACACRVCAARDQSNLI